ncbi:hypothetical protein IC006_0738 [Sulfuracidifex tepidarius]|uniref:Uncharacterized protein n=1 Tax=Sulfuracidifex tepidarius TaxID=1294262 RepID=A0A510DTH0_9CREN|nr:hypothetical protein IC006_0738 [Sulfuracidifex tepidarius]
MRSRDEGEEEIGKERQLQALLQKKGVKGAESLASLRRGWIVPFV